MNTLTSIPLRSLYWNYDKETFSLRCGDETILDLKEEKHNFASFHYNDLKYQIKNEGFWNPRTIIKNDTTQVLELRRHFLGTKGEIIFNNGQTYICKIKNSPLVKLSFFTADEKELLSFNLKTSLKPNAVKTIMDVNPDIIPQDEMIMLIALGCFSFKGISMENQDSDFIIMAAAGS